MMKRGILRSPAGLVGALLVAIVLLTAIIGPELAGTRATHIDPGDILLGASGKHLLGTDDLGRDILARVIVATRTSLVLAAAATGIGVVIGIPLGVVPSVLPPRGRQFVANVIGTLVSFPGLLLAMFTSIVLGLGARGAVFGIGIAAAPALARLTLTLSSSVGGSDYVAAARILRVSRLRIMTRHILPNIAEPLILNITMIMTSALIGLAGLSFIGLGVQPPSYDWGVLLSDGLGNIYLSPAGALGPAAAILLAGVGLSLLGERLARVAAKDPSTQRPARAGWMTHWRRLAASMAHRPQAAQAAQAAHAGQAGQAAHAGQAGRAGQAGQAAATAQAPGGGETPRTRDALEPPDAQDEPDRDAVLDIQDLKVTFPAGTPVKGISLRVEAGEIVGIVGESGSGKSLTALAVSGLVPYPGTTSTTRHRIAGAEVSTLSKTARRKLLGGSLAMVFQDPMSSLNPAMRVGTQLAEVPRTHERMPRRAAWRRAVDRLGQVRITEPARRARQRPHEFSGGMRQRAAIAIGLMGTPRLLIADEPTTALDVTVQRKILELLTEVTGSTGTGALFISHDIAVVSQLCDRIVVMYAGRVVEELPSSKLTDSPAHPYTRALIAAVPDMRTDRGKPLATVPGQLPGIDEDPPGCAFASRCAHATTACLENKPELTKLDDTEHRLACFNPQATRELT